MKNIRRIRRLLSTLAVILMNRCAISPKDLFLARSCMIVTTFVVMSLLVRIVSAAEPIIPISGDHFVDIRAGRTSTDADIFQQRWSSLSPISLSETVSYSTVDGVDTGRLSANASISSEAIIGSASFSVEKQNLGGISSGELLFSYGFEVAEPTELHVQAVIRAEASSPEQFSVYLAEISVPCIDGDFEAVGKHFTAHFPTELVIDEVCTVSGRNSMWAQLRTQGVGVGLAEVSFDFSISLPADCPPTSSIFDQSPLTASMTGATLNPNPFTNQAQIQNFAEQVRFAADVTLTGMDIYSHPAFGLVGDGVVIRIRRDLGGAPGDLLHEFNENISIVDQIGSVGAETRKHADFALPVHIQGGTPIWIGMSGNGVEIAQGGLNGLPSGDNAMARFEGTTFAGFSPGTGDMAFRLFGIAACQIERPTADAGTDQLVAVGSTVFLDGSGSTDPDGDPLTFQWTLTSPAGSGSVLFGADTVSPNFVPDFEGLYEASLLVSDPVGPGTSDNVEITAIPPVQFAEMEIDSASESVVDLVPDQVTTEGNQNGLINFLRQATIAIEEGDIAEAINKLQKALSRTDGCELRGVPDGNGPARDWITDCEVQMAVYKLLSSALMALTL